MVARATTAAPMAALTAVPVRAATVAQTAVPARVATAVPMVVPMAALTAVPMVVPTVAQTAVPMVAQTAVPAADTADRSGGRDRTDATPARPALARCVGVQTDEFATSYWSNRPL